MQPLFRGVGVALLTFFDEAGNLDSETTAVHAERMINFDIQGILIAGTTGENSLLQDFERTQLVCIAAFNGDAQALHSLHLQRPQGVPDLKAKTAQRFGTPTHCRI